MIWLIGHKGMLGQDLYQEIENCGLDIIGTDRELSILDLDKLDKFAGEHQPDWIINCSAYTAVDDAEDNPEAAFALNQQGVRNLTLLAHTLDIPLIHFSTDYVFDGNSEEPLDEGAVPQPIGVYGKSKLAGEEEIRSICSRYFIIRTAWLYGKEGQNFVYTMLKLMNKLDKLKVVDDQKGSPTWTRDICRLITQIISNGSELYGTYHLSGEGQCSWYQFANAIYAKGRELGLLKKEAEIQPCSSAEFPTKAQRPRYSLLCKNKVWTSFTYRMPQWEESLATFLKGITKNDIR